MAVAAAHLPSLDGRVLRSGDRGGQPARRPGARAVWRGRAACAVRDRAGGAGPLAAILAAAGTAGEFRHRTAAATFLAEPRRARVITAKLIIYLLAGAGYALACVAASLAVALPWLAARGTPVSLAAHGNLAVLAAVIISVALFGVTGAGLGALLGSEVITITGLLLYLYVALGMMASGAMRSELDDRLLGCPIGGVLLRDGWLMRKPDTLRSRRYCRPRIRPASGTRPGWSLHVRCGPGVFRCCG